MNPCALKCIQKRWNPQRVCDMFYMKNNGRAICDSSHTVHFVVCQCTRALHVYTVCAHLHFDYYYIFSKVKLRSWGYGYMLYGYKDTICLKGNKTCAKRYRFVDYYAFNFFFRFPISCALVPCTLAHKRLLIIIFKIEAMLVSVARRLIVQIVK